MALKKRLAKDLVQQYHGASAATAAEEHFEQTIQRRETPEDQLYEAPPRDRREGMKWGQVLLDAGLAESATQAKRLIDQGASRYNEETVTSNVAADSLPFRTGDTIRVGRRSLRVVSPD